VSREPVIWRGLCYRSWSEQNAAVLKKYGTWRRMWLRRPRLLFEGVWVSRNTYLRPGQRQELASFTTPIHQVLYYRMFRFFPDGTVLSTMSFEEPKEIIQWFQPWFKQEMDNGTGKRWIRSGFYQFDSVDGDIKINLKDSREAFQYETFYFWLKCRSKKSVANGVMAAVDFYSINEITNEETDFSYDVSRMSNFHFVRVPKSLLYYHEPVNQ